MADAAKKIKSGQWTRFRRPYAVTALPPNKNDRERGEHHDENQQSPQQIANPLPARDPNSCPSRKRRGRWSVLLESELLSWPA